MLCFTGVALSMVSVCHAVAVGVIDEAATAAASARAALGGAAMGGRPSACPELHGGPAVTRGWAQFFTKIETKSGES